MAKTAQKKTAEELIEKSKKAFNSKLVVEIVEKAPVNKDGKVNLTKAHDQVFEHVFKQTADLKTAKEFAVAARWLAMLRRDYPDVFQAGIDVQKFSDGFQKETSESKPEPRDVEIGLCGDIISKGGCFSTHSLRIKGIDMPGQSIIMAGKFLEVSTDVVYKNDNGEFVYSFDTLRDYLIQILEEKFGVKIKICGSCADYCDRQNYERVRCNAGIYFADPLSGECEKWRPKEIPEEKKEEEETCGNCGYEDCVGLKMPCGNWI